MRVLLCLIAFFLYPVLLSAQTSVVGNEQLGWDQAGPTLAAVQGYAYDAKDGTVAATSLSGVTCAGTASPFLCQTRLPALTTGLHALAVIAKTTVNGTVLASAPSAPLSLLIVAVPALPQNVRIL